MIILGIDTATTQVGCAVGGPLGPLASFHASRGRRHAEALAPAIAFVCAQADVGYGQLGAIAVDIGPGLFTGLRVGVATGKAMASALGVQMIGVTSLDLLAVPHRRGHRLIVAMVDARRDEVFWALYRPTPDGVERLTAYAVDPPARVVAELVARGEDYVAVGDGARRYAGSLDGVRMAGGVVEVDGVVNAYPSAAVLVEQARILAAAGQCVPPEELTPLYLRTADIRINWEQRRPVGAGAADREAL